MDPGWTTLLVIPGTHLQRAKATQRLLERQGFLAAVRPNGGDLEIRVPSEEAHEAAEVLREAGFLIGKGA